MKPCGRPSRPWWSVVCSPCWWMLTLYRRPAAGLLADDVFLIVKGFAFHFISCVEPFGPIWPPPPRPPAQRFVTLPSVSRKQKNKTKQKNTKKDNKNKQSTYSAEAHSQTHTNTHTDINTHKHAQINPRLVFKTPVLYKPVTIPGAFVFNDENFYIPCITTIIRHHAL